MSLRPAFLWLLFAIPLLAQAASNPASVKLDDTSKACLSSSLGAYLEVRVEKASDLNLTCRLYTGYFQKKGFNLKKLKIKKTSKTRARVPYLALSPAFKRVFLKKMWPKDKLVGKNWHHRVKYPHETLWTISQMYTGFGNNYSKIRKRSGLPNDRVKKGMLLKIPENLLMELIRVQPDLTLAKLEDPVFATQAQLDEEQIMVEETTPVVSEPAVNSEIKPQEPEKRVEKKVPKETQAQLDALVASRQELRWGSDNQGAYAEYRLKAGEAIYTSVVVRFCGLVEAADVRRVAAEIIKRNRIVDETDMAIGTPIRIPQDFLEPEFKAPGDEQFEAYLANLKAVGRIDTRLLANNLVGVHIILDAGHGGADPGTYHKRVWEDDYVYDIICRIKRRLESQSAAKVITTVFDPSIKYQVQDVNRFRLDRDEILMTRPPFKLDSRRVTTDGVNLRWMMANNRYKELRTKGVLAENVVFASFHADALTPKLRGSMIYIPDARAYPRSVEIPNRKLRIYQEARGNSFKFGPKTMREAQARSMAFAKNYVERSRSNGIRVHNHKPIRTQIYKNRYKPFVPAVLRFNRIPTRLLIEVCNLNNKEDQTLLRRPDFRQSVADSFVEAVYQTYGIPANKSGKPGTKVIARRSKSEP